eukprot:Filipodium_phascolosomae@DN6140_c0_g1_i1.p1
MLTGVSLLAFLGLIGFIAPSTKGFTVLTTAEFFYSAIQGGTRDAEFRLEISELDEAGKRGWIHIQLKDGMKWTALSMKTDLPNVRYTDGETTTVINPTKASHVYIKFEDDIRLNTRYTILLSLDVPVLDRTPAHTTILLGTSHQQLVRVDGFSIAPIPVAQVKKFSACWGSQHEGTETYAGVNFQITATASHQNGRVVSIEMETFLNQTQSRATRPNYYIGSLQEWELSVTMKGIATTCFIQTKDSEAER